MFLRPSPVPSVHSRDRKGLWGPKVDVITRSSGVKNKLVWQTGQEAGHPTYHVTKIRECMDRRITLAKRVTSPNWGPSPPRKQALKL